MVNAVVGEHSPMAWYALDDIGDAIDATKELVMPFDWWVWLRLGIVVSLLGGAGGGLTQLTNVFQFGSSPDFEVEGFLASTVGDPGVVTALAGADPGIGSALAQTQPGEVDWAEVLVDPAMIFVVAFVLLAVLALLLLGAIGTAMEFVLVQTLRRERVHVGHDFGANYGNGLRLVIFRYVMWAIAVAIVGGAFVWQLGTDPTAWSDADVLGVLAPLLLIAVPTFLLVSVINGFTNVFVVPIMLTEDRSLLSAWRRLLGLIGGNLGQFLLYLVVSVLLGIGVSIVLGFAVLFAAIAIGIPVGIVAVALYIALSGPILWILAGAVVFVGIVAFAVAVMFISVPLLVFLRYYALFVLGDVDESVDPIPEVRSNVRGDADIPRV